MGQAGELFERGNLKAQRLADFARGGAAAVGDDVGGHGGAELAVALVDVLDGALALIAAGEIDIDIGPFAALFGEETLEEQLHADGIDGGDAERIADGAVGGRTAALAEDAVIAAEVHDVPHDEEIAGEIEFLDEGQLALDLLAGALVVGDVAEAGALVGALAQETHHGLAFGDGIARELVAEVGEGEVEARCDLGGVGDGVGNVGEERGHFGGRFDAAFGVLLEQSAGFGERGLIADAGEDVEQFALRGRDVRRLVGGDQGNAEAAGALHDGLVFGLFFTAVVALDDRHRHCLCRRHRADAHWGCGSGR